MANMINLTINPLIIEASEGMGSTKLQQLFKVKIPLALPVLMSGIRNMVWNTNRNITSKIISKLA